MIGSSLLNLLSMGLDFMVFEPDSLRFWYSIPGFLTLHPVFFIIPFFVSFNIPCSEDSDAVDRFDGEKPWDQSELPKEKNINISKYHYAT